MKIILTLLFSFTNFAQDSRLFENIWYLNDLIIDDIHNIPPVNDEIQYVPANFIEPDGFSTGICESSGIGQIVYNSNTDFTFQNLAFLAGGCYQNEPFNELFNNLYVYRYWMDTYEDVYLYSITENANIRTLTIINSNGDEAIYGN